MYKHHQESIENYIQNIKKDPDVIAVILGGSVAKNCSRSDSDIDITVVVTPQKFVLLNEQHITAECITELCTYENGYFDIKYCEKIYLEQTGIQGSEPSRSAFCGAQCIYSIDKDIPGLINKIPVFQIAEKEDKMLSLYSAFILNCNYFWGIAEEDVYLQARTAADIVFYGLRLLLQDNDILFPCHRELKKAVVDIKTVDQSTLQNIVDSGDQFLKSFDNTIKEEFQNAVLNSIRYIPPEKYEEVLSRYVDDNELWWYKNRPYVELW